MEGGPDPGGVSAADAAELVSLAIDALGHADPEQIARRSVALAEAAADEHVSRLAVALAAAAREHAEHETELRQRHLEFEEAQRLGQMGSYDWDITTDTNRWSDELYRIYGCEPQSFNATYERFLGFLHPDDRDAVQEVHRIALAGCEPYHTVERIIRPDGELRVLDTWGEVVADDQGVPARMRGICRDITDHYNAERTARIAAERLAAIVGATPDALLVVAADGSIRDANEQVGAVLRYDREELIGQSVDLLLPERFRSQHEMHRRNFFLNPHARSMGIGLELFARRKDGTEIPVDVALGSIQHDNAPAAVAFLRDVSERRRAEELALRLREADQARRRALEINDNVVQGLASALLRLEVEGTGSEEVVDRLRRTLDAARGIISDLLGDGAIEPGSLLRTAAADTSHG